MAREPGLDLRHLSVAHLDAAAAAGPFEVAVALGNELLPPSARGATPWRAGQSIVSKGCSGILVSSVDELVDCTALLVSEAGAFASRLAARVAGQA